MKEFKGKQMGGVFWVEELTLNLTTGHSIDQHFGVITTLKNNINQVF